MTVIFEAKTSEGYTIKVLSELLQTIIRTACFEINKNGIYMRMMDSNRNILMDIELNSTNFNTYELLRDETMYLGINLGHFYKMLKSIKKKDALTIKIDDVEPDQLTLIVYPKENNRISKSSVRIQVIQHINVPLPSGYTNPVIIPSSDYQRALKDMNNIGNIDTLTIQMKKYSIIMSCSAQGIYTREVMFGELNDATNVHYCEIFNMEQFIRVMKITGLSKKLQIYNGNKSLPIKLVSMVGLLGTISIFIKSQEQVRIDNITDDKCENYWS